MLVTILTLIVIAIMTLIILTKRPAKPLTASLSAAVTISGTIQATHPLGSPRANSTTIYANAYEAEFRALGDRLNAMGC